MPNDGKCYGGRKSKIGLIGRTGQGRERFVIAHKVKKEELSNKVTFELRPKGGEKVLCESVTT